MDDDSTPRHLTPLARSQYEPANFALCVKVSAGGISSAISPPPPPSRRGFTSAKINLRAAGNRGEIGQFDTRRYQSAWRGAARRRRDVTDNNARNRSAWCDSEAFHSSVLFNFLTLDICTARRGAASRCAREITNCAPSKLLLRPPRMSKRGSRAQR